MATRKHVTQQITESFSGVGSPTIDREKNIVRGMKIASPKSANGRDYTEALKGSARLYENAPVSLNHPANGQVPTAESRFGKFVNVVERDGGVYGDLAYNPKHVHAEQILWAVEHQPDTLANSHRVEAQGRKVGGELKVEKLTRVRGVEIVSEGGMQKTLFEAEDAAAEAPAAADSLEMKSCIVRVLATGVSESEAHDICSASMAEAPAKDDEKPTEPPAADAATESIVMTGKTLAELTPSEILAARPDLKPIVLREHANDASTEAERAAIKAKLDRLAVLEAAEARKAKLVECRALCEGMDAGLVTDAFVESLADVSDASAKALVEERKALSLTAKPAKPTSRVAPTTGALTSEKLLEAISS